MIEVNNVIIPDIIKKFIDILLHTNNLTISKIHVGDEKKSGFIKYRVTNSDYGFIIEDGIEGKKYLLFVCRYLNKSNTSYIPLNEDHLIRYDLKDIKFSNDKNSISGSVVIDYFKNRLKYKKENYIIVNNEITELYRAYGYIEYDEFVFHSYNGASMLRYKKENEDKWMLERKFWINNTDYTDTVEKWIKNHNIELKDDITFKDNEDIVALQLYI